MLLLSFESSSLSASVAVTDGRKLLGQSFQNVGLTHSRTLLPMAESLLKNMDMKISDMDAFAVSNGPGSFTGVRIGVATVKGLAQSLDKKCIGVSSLQAAAAGFMTDKYICAVMDARAGQVYNSIFKWENDKIIRLCQDRAISIENLGNELKCSNKEYFLVGDGTSLCYNELNEVVAGIKKAPENMIFPTAYGVAYLAQDVEFYNADMLEPFYLRIPQAERQRLGKLLPSDIK